MDKQKALCYYEKMVNGAYDQRYYLLYVRRGLVTMFANRVRYVAVGSYHDPTYSITVKQHFRKKAFVTILDRRVY